MSPESRRLAGILLVVLPTVVYGGVNILSLLKTTGQTLFRYEICSAPPTMYRLT